VSGGTRTPTPCGPRLQRGEPANCSTDTRRPEPRAERKISHCGVSGLEPPVLRHSASSRHDPGSASHLRCALQHVPARMPARSVSRRAPWAWAWPCRAEHPGPSTG